MKIVVLDGYCLNPGDLSWEDMSSLGDLQVYDRTSPSELLERAEGAEVLITNKTLISDKDMDALPELKYIGVLATGYNVVDVEAAKKKGIVVTNIPAYSTRSVAQMVFAHILNITQRVEHYACLNRQGKWSDSADFSYWDTELIELDGKWMGIVGFGNIGQATARIALAFGMKVAVFTSKPQSDLPEGVIKMDLDQLFSTCDVVSLHCPLTPSTKEMVNAKRLNLMKPNAILINTGRGPLVNEQDLADALNEVLSEKWRGLRGIEIVSFGVSSVKAEEEDEKMIKEMQRNAAFMDPTRAAAHLVGAQAAAMQSAAANEGAGSAMAFMGMNMAQGAGGVNAQNLYAMGQQQAQQAAPASGWKCSCGATASGKFCPECGDPFDDGDIK